MDLVFLVVNGVGLILDFFAILLDLNFFLVHSLVSILVWLIAFVCNLPSTLVACASHCWNGFELFLLCIAEALYYLMLASAHFVFGLLRDFCSSMESLKVVGNLFVHLMLRGKEVMHRGLWNLVGSGQSFLRQVCEVCAIVMSLVAYFVNSIINICLIGTQNLFSLSLVLWETVISPFLRVTDMFAAFLAHLTSSAIAMVILLWSPCQLAFELLTSVSMLLINIFFLNIYGIILLCVIVTTIIVILYPRQSRAGVNQVSSYLNTIPAYRRLRRNMYRLYQIVLLSLAMVQRSQAWRRLADWSLQMAIWNRGSGEETHLRVGQEQQLGDGVALPAWAYQRRPDEGPSTSHAAAKEQLGAVEENSDPWELLKEQEDRKKCVICQDQTKTVLLLPCRHLCLCRSCTEILLQQAVYQRNCPLCRQMILQTLNVYL